MANYDELLKTYETIHQSPINRVLHAIGIPTIMIAVAGFASIFQFSARLGFAGNIGFLLVVITVLITSSWSIRAALAYSPLAILVYGISFLTTNTLPFVTLLLLYGGLFIGGWIIQFLGHGFEGKSPEFVSRPENLLLGPISVMLEIFPILRPNTPESTQDQHSI